MTSCSPHPAVERARPLLGTFVSVRVRQLDSAHAYAAIEDAFASVASIHARMSFHDPASDVARLNREAHHGPVAVHPDTIVVLRRAQEIAVETDGCFDVTVAPRLVAWGRLPRLGGACRPDRHATWRDIELCDDETVRFLRPLWIDLGGIAKGYAVDCAAARLSAHGVTRGCVNAGGDLRVIGAAPEPIKLRTDAVADKTAAIVELADGSLASSSGRLPRRRRRCGFEGAHIHGASRRIVGTRRFACVLATRCMDADALTKVVLAEGRRAHGILRRLGATAYLHDARGRWCCLGVGR